MPSDPKRGTVYLTGAGPGDPELLTVKAMRVLQGAEVLIYDRLVHRQILDLAPEPCLRLYVGKKDGHHLLPQDEINRLLRHHALDQKVVVRLKGGDPFLFGRGGEEALFLAQHQVPFEVIPGVSSAMGVPAYAGIPITHRGIASHCTILTGHLSKHSPEQIPWASLNHQGTLVFLMGVSGRQEIARRLILHGRPETEPVAFIEKGTTSKHHIWRGTLSQVAHQPPEIQTPALFVVGEVVRLSDAIQWFQPDPQPEPLPFQHHPKSHEAPSEPDSAIPPPIGAIPRRS